MRFAAAAVGIGVFLSTTGAHPEEATPVPDLAHAVKSEVGDLTVIGGDHYPHGGSDRPSYTGIHTS
jgi:hypothetical protein